VARWSVTASTGIGDRIRPLVEMGRSTLADRTV
jgi:hypothetical protein